MQNQESCTAEVTLFDNRCGVRVKRGDARLGIMGFMRIVRIMEKRLGASLNSHLVCPGAVVMGGKVRSRRESTASTTNAQI